MSLPHTILHRLLNKRESVDVTFLTRPGCHLCEEAEPIILREFGVQNVDVLNILEHPDLEDQYVFRIPVILCDGRVIAEGAFGRREVQRARRLALRYRREGRSRT